MIQKQQKKAVAEALILNYFNDALLKAGAIDQQVWRQMSAKIRNRGGAQAKRKQRDEWEAR